MLIVCISFVSFTCVLLSVYVSTLMCVCDVSCYRRLGVGMCGMLGDVNGDIPGALALWTTAENDRSRRKRRRNRVREGGEEQPRRREGCRRDGER